MGSEMGLQSGIKVAHWKRCWYNSLMIQCKEETTSMIFSFLVFLGRVSEKKKVYVFCVFSPMRSGKSETGPHTGWL